MQSPFLVCRFVFFALLVNLNILILAFASWNVNATVAAGLSVPATTIFFIFNCCLVFFFVALGFAEIFVPRAFKSRLAFECAWSMVLSVVQTGTAISVTVHGPATCRLTADWDLCASSFVLIPTAWLSSITLFTYFLVLFITTMAHIGDYRDIWSQTVYSIDWFNPEEPTSWNEKKNRHSDSDADSWSHYMDDIEVSRRSLGCSDDNEKAPWARSIRRGIDAPFKRQDHPPSARSSPSATHTTLPLTPLKVQSRSIAGSRFIETFRESRVVARSEAPSQYGLHFTNRQEPFPPHVENHDLPIPLPRLSEWIRADAIKGINVHTMPASP
ncbi:hypothetical protein Hypma_011509 [Hypsizygus marmoreus]|uniref:Uncharacterized protein n=1 Tax=Hypsizygus marmoreus TaxID=39966 RepID=A0A369JKN4_HYPMA|nr:hypothetical protein Hypma_011509 [Hypsizygus marmoreus]